MDSLIEKYGIKKVLFIIGGIFLTLFLILFFIKRINNGDKKLFECSKSVAIKDFSNVENIINYYKANDDFKFVITYKFDLISELNEIEKYNIKNEMENILDNEMNSFFGNSRDYLTTSYKYDEKSFEYKISIIVNDESQYYVSADLDYDIYNLSVDEIINTIEEGGYKCSK